MKFELIRIKGKESVVMNLPKEKILDFLTHMVEVGKYLNKPKFEDIFGYVVKIDGKKMKLENAIRVIESGKLTKTDDGLTVDERGTVIISPREPSKIKDKKKNGKKSKKKKKDSKKNKKTKSLKLLDHKGEKKGKKSKPKKNKISLDELRKKRKKKGGKF